MIDPFSDSKKVRIYVRADDKNKNFRTISFRAPASIPAIWWLTEAKATFAFAIDGNSVISTVEPLMSPDYEDEQKLTLAQALAEQEKYIVKVLTAKGYEVEFA